MAQRVKQLFGLPENYSHRVLYYKHNIEAMKPTLPQQFSFWKALG